MAAAPLWGPPPVAREDGGGNGGGMGLHGGGPRDAGHLAFGGRMAVYVTTYETTVVADSASPAVMAAARSNAGGATPTFAVAASTGPSSPSSPSTNISTNVSTPAAAAATLTATAAVAGQVLAIEVATPAAVATADTAVPVTVVTGRPSPSTTDVMAAAPAAAARAGRPGLDTGTGPSVLRWQADAAVRSRPSPDVTPTAAGDTDEASATPDAGTVAAASVLPVVAAVDARPLWQRVALMTVGGLLVTANWVIRRRQRAVLARA